MKFCQTISSNLNGCPFQIDVYPSDAMWAEFEDRDNTWRLTATIGSVFVITTLLFLVYNCLVETRQTVVMTQAVETSQIVSSLFPVGFREGVISQQKDGRNMTTNKKLKRMIM